MSLRPSSVYCNFIPAGSTTVAIDNLINLADKISQKSDGIAFELYEMTLEKIKGFDCVELSNCKLQYSFGKFLFQIKDYERANKVLKEALEYSDKNNVSGEFS